MSQVVIATIAVLAIIFVVPIAVYGAFSTFLRLQTPRDAPLPVFLMGVFISKVGTAIAFVWIYDIGREHFSDRWAVYALAWWLMFVLGEIGQAIGPGYTWNDAVAGVASETIYLPLAAYTVYRLA